MIKKDGKTYTVRAFWRDMNGNRCSKQKTGFKTQAAAAEWENEITRTGQNVAYADAHRLTVDALFDIWLDHLRKIERSYKTIGSYSDTRSKITSQIGNMLVQDVKRVHIQSVIDTIRTTPHMRTVHYGPGKSLTKQVPGSLPSSSTVDSAFRTIRALFNFAVSESIIPVSPVGRGIDKPPVKHKTKTVYTAEQLAQLINLLSEQQHVLMLPIYLCVYFGVRRGEALGVRWCDIDTDSGTINIRGNLTSYYDNDTKHEYTIFKEVKSHFSCASVEATEHVLSVLKTVKAQRFEQGLVHNPPSVDVLGTLFLDDLDKRDFLCLDEQCGLFRPGGLRARLQNFQRANGLPLCSIHGLRHTYATLLVESGLDIAVVSKALRHSSIKVTSDMYVESTKKIKTQASVAMDNLVSLKPNGNNSSSNSITILSNK